jgi:CRP-like cAMP-binding protein
VLGETTVTADDGRDAILATLASMPVFDGVHTKTLEEILDHSELIDIRDGDLLTVEDEVGTEVFVILDGRAVVTLEGRELAVLEAPDFFGEISAFQGDERTASVRAITPMRALVLDRHAYAQLLSEEPVFGARVLTAVRDRMDALLTDL